MRIKGDLGFSFTGSASTKIFLSTLTFSTSDSNRLNRNRILKSKLEPEILVHIKRAQDLSCFIIVLYREYHQRRHYAISTRQFAETVFATIHPSTISRVFTTTNETQKRPMRMENQTNQPIRNK